MYVTLGQSAAISLLFGTGLAALLTNSTASKACPGKEFWRLQRRVVQRGLIGWAARPKLGYWRSSQYNVPHIDSMEVSFCVLWLTSEQYPYQGILHLMIFMMFEIALYASVVDLSITRPLV